MTTDDVHGDDMAHPELSDEQLAALLDGSPDTPVDHPVADAIIRARRQLGAEPVPTPGPALSEFLGVGHVADPIPPSAAAGDLLDVTAAAEPSPRRIPVLASLSAFVGTITGKILVGTTVAAASLGGAHAVGVVDVPGLPDTDDAAVTETIDDREDDTDLDDTDLDDTDDSNSGPDDDSADDSNDDDSSDDDSSDDDSSDDDSSDDDSTDDVATTSTTTTPTTTTPTTTTTTAPTTTSSSSTTTTVPSSSTTPPAGTVTKAYTVAGVGTTTVTVSNGQISLVSAVPAAGWVLDEAGPDEDGVESKYVMGELETRIDFEIEDGQLRVRIREENDATDERTERFEYFPL